MTNQPFTAELENGFGASQLTEVVRLLRTARYMFVVLGVAFLAWETFEVLLQDETVTFWVLVEVGLISVVSPLFIWKVSKRGESRVGDAGLRHAELVTASRRIQLEVGQHDRAGAPRRELTELRLRELANLSVRMHEQERKRVAEQLDDRVAQPLSSVLLQLQVLQSMTWGDVQARPVTQRLTALIEGIVRRSRGITNDLYPPGLDEFGVVRLIESELRRFQGENECRVTFDARTPTMLSQEVELTLYRILREALGNIERHALGVRNVAVSIVHGNRAVTLVVHDDGSGFDVNAAEGTRSGGLANMRRRVEIMGGTSEVTSTIGQGTIVTVTIPVDNGDI